MKFTRAEREVSYMGSHCQVSRIGVEVEFRSRSLMSDWCSNSVQLHVVVEDRKKIQRLSGSDSLIVPSLLVRVIVELDTR